MDATLVLISGTPGAGKTLTALQMAIELAIGRPIKGMSTEEIKEALAQSKRNLVLIGVEGADESIFQTADNPFDWQEFPDGTIFVVDEIWKWWGDHEAGKIKSDPRVLAMAVHRHRGMSFFITCQMPAQVLEHIKGLANKHIHVTRKFGTEMSILYEWPQVTGSPNSQGQRTLAQSRDWFQPKNIFSLYQSASIHTIKRKIPLKLVLMIVLIPVAIVLGWVAVSFVTSIGSDVAGPVAAATAATGGGAGRTGPPVTASQYVEAFTPRIPSQPWSAPAYDGQEPTAVPRVFCMSTETTCRCMTEQATRYKMPATQCRLIARWGQYEPFKPDVSRRDQSDAFGNRDDRREPMPSRGGPVGAAARPGEIGTGQEGQVW